jgi:membrane protease YdiL (CAAX protease family)
MEMFGMLAAMAVFYGFIGIVGIVFYVLQALAMQTIANRRGIANGWLAWIPIGSMWLMGAIADDYRQKAKGEKKNRRAILLWSALIVLVIVGFMYGTLFGALLEIAEIEQEMDELHDGYYYDWDEYYELQEEMDDVQDEMEDTMVTYILLMIPLAVLGIVAVVFQYICLYDIYNSCDPGNAVIFLILSIFVSGLCSILLFVDRNKDLGMRPPVQYAPYGYMPYGQPYQPPYQQPPYQQPPYQQPPYQQPPYQQPPYQQPPQDPNSQW